MDRPVDGHRPAPEAALRQLLRKGAGYDSGPGQLARYQRHRVSLPKDQSEAVPLADLLEGHDQECVEKFEYHMKLGDEEIAGVLEDTEETGCHLDQELDTNDMSYACFVMDLFNSGLIGFTSTPKVLIGALFVKKKNSSLRLGIDARKANKLLRRPPSTVLGTMESWGAGRVGRG